MTRVDYDFCDFETRDEIDEARQRDYERGAGYADRPGTRRALGGADWTHDPALPRVIEDFALAAEFGLEPGLLEESA